MSYVLRKFMPEAQVSYVGQNDSLKSSIGGTLGVIAAPVQGTTDEYVVVFGKDAYVIKEDSLTNFNGQLKPVEEKQSKEVKVERRRGRIDQDDLGDE